MPAAAEASMRAKRTFTSTRSRSTAVHYEPFWKRCVELGVAVTQHSGSSRWSGRASISNFTFNHAVTSPNRTTHSARASSGRRAHAITTLNFGSWGGGELGLPDGVRSHRALEKRSARIQSDRTDLDELKRYTTAMETRSSRQRRGDHGEPRAFRPECTIEEWRTRHVVDDFEASGVKSKATAFGVREQFLFRLRGGRSRDDVRFRSPHGCAAPPVFSSDFTHSTCRISGGIPSVRDGRARYMTEQAFREFTSVTLQAALRNNRLLQGHGREDAVASELGSRSRRRLSRRKRSGAGALTSSPTRRR